MTDASSPPVPSSSAAAPSPSSTSQPPDAPAPKPAPLTVAAARALILADVEPRAAETVDIAEVAGRVLAEAPRSLLTQPPFDASAMDGYAVRSCDLTAGAITLDVIGESAAGHPFQGSVGTGQAVRIFTGAPLPDGADAVLLQEDARLSPDHQGAHDHDGPQSHARVTFEGAQPDPGYVRKRGMDFTAGTGLLATGTALEARHVALAAAAGHAALRVVQRPRVAIIATGDELVLPGTVPAAGQIVSSNHLGVAALLRAAGAAPRFIGIARDTTADLQAALDQAWDADLIITIGGASVGDHDLVGPVLRDNGTTIGFWKIAMRPGKPLMFGTRGATRVIGLPGNPVSALICTRLFAVPLVRAMLGLGEGSGAAGDVPTYHPTIAPLAANGPREHYMRARFEPGQAGAQTTVRALRSQDSSLLSLLAEADALIVRPIHAPAVDAGTPVPVLPLGV
ncbi:MAG: gephyrin-like molybdotransferase Glp [Pseudomonadota bacterium]